MFTGGVAAYKFVKDYPDLRQGVKLLLQDIKTIVKKIVGEDFDVDQKYPPEAGDNIDLCETGTGVSS